MEITTSVRRSRRGRARAAIAAVLALGAFAGIASSAQAATLTITRHTDPANDPTPVTYHVDFSPHPGTSNGPGSIPSDFDLIGGQSKTFTVDKGFFTVTEKTPAGWKLVSIDDCFTDDTDPADKTVIDVGKAQAVFELSSDEHKGCTFTDAKVQQPTPPVTPPVTPAAPAPPPETPVAQVAPSQQPGVAVSPARARQGAAKLLAPSRCVSRRFTVAVSGSPVRSVTWIVNGRRIKTVTAKTGQRRFTVVLGAAAVQRITAQVTFVADATPRTKTLRATVRRCVPSAVSPQFTG
jgi:hypothetical protein